MSAECIFQNNVSHGFFLLLVLRVCMSDPFTFAAAVQLLFNKTIVYVYVYVISNQCQFWHICSASPPLPTYTDEHNTQKLSGAEGERRGIKSEVETGEVEGGKREGGRSETMFSVCWGCRWVFFGRMTSLFLFLFLSFTLPLELTMSSPPPLRFYWQAEEENRRMEEMWMETKEEEGERESWGEGEEKGGGGWKEI